MSIDFIFINKHITSISTNSHMSTNAHIYIYIDLGEW